MKNENPAGGLFVRGVVVSSSASAYRRKDGTGMFVKVRHEIATQPGVLPLEQFMDPKEISELRLNGETVESYPRLPQFESVTLKILRYRADRDRFTVTEFERMPDSESVPG